MKMLMWYRVDVAFKLRLADLIKSNLTYEEVLQRVEELVWVRDEIKSLIEEKEYEPAIQESTDVEKALKLEELDRSKGIEWSSHQESHGWTDSCGSGRCGESGQREISQDGQSVPKL